MDDPGEDVARHSPSAANASDSPKPSTANGDNTVRVSRHGSHEGDQTQPPRRNPPPTSQQSSQAPAVVLEHWDGDRPPAVSPSDLPRDLAAPPEVDKTTTPADPVQSQPMTTSTSATSHPSDKDSTPPPAAYGTRSRNKPGVPRPNYAEDVEMDFETAPHQPNGGDHSSMDLSSRSPPPIDSRQSPVPAAVKAAGPTANGWSAVNANASIPGTSLFSANPNARMPHGKKRKVAEVQGNGTAHSQSPAPSTQAVTRRSNAVPASTTSATPVSNMFAFEKCRNLVNKQGKLVADDGTVFSPNGKCSTSLHLRRLLISSCLMFH